MRIKGETPHFQLKRRSFSVLVAGNNKKSPFNKRLFRTKDSPQLIIESHLRF